MHLISGWLPRSLAGRTALIFVVGLLVAQLGSLFLHVQERAGMLGHGAMHGAHRWAGLPPAFIGLMGLTALAVLAASLLAMRWASKPLEDLATAATAFASDLNAPPLPETGPIEVRSAAAAFNFMQARLKQTVLGRGRALAAVSHDLRTPLTRMRLRVELVEDAALRDKLDADIEAMSAMVDSVLAYLRGIEDAEAVRPVDMLALVESIVEDDQALGHDVRFARLGDASSPVPLMARPTLLRRAIVNLVDNARHHGHTVTVTLQDGDRGWVGVAVEDDGPGIAPEDMERALQPFVRLDAAAGPAKAGGVGLGLSIARDAAAMHGGELVLENRAEGGLRAMLRLPRGQG
ncbi:HAMP domain-containing protein [Ramlibacter sp. AW1]|uniref:histidine kinase n=1 Tax=Ramlibacter aurantiacus TaxID=2801330 RepID=A0A936ZT44_9BURK|nr:ATP-binding protein [Ramlibacter aurantiacus]MBL0420660.1 HAMP domain-containing protein [Ramlibacter aurantiacus]